MKAAPLLVAWHDNNDPIYSAHFETHGKGRLATAGGDSLVRVCWIALNERVENSKLTGVL
jgi:chromatin assembly factor 1 subunit B